MSAQAIGDMGENGDESCIKERRSRILNDGSLTGCHLVLGNIPFVPHSSGSGAPRRKPIVGFVSGGHRITHPSSLLLESLLGTWSGLPYRIRHDIRYARCEDCPARVYWTILQYWARGLR